LRKAFFEHLKQETGPVINRPEFMTLLQDAPTRFWEGKFSIFCMYLCVYGGGRGHVCISTLVCGCMHTKVEACMHVHLCMCLFIYVFVILIM